MANEVDSMTVIGDVAGKDVVLIDDMCDTAGTLTKAAELMMEHGALSVRAMCTHAVLSGPAYERIENSVLTELVVSDSIPLKTDKPINKIKVLSAQDMFAKTLTCLMENRSISSSLLIH